MIINYSKRVNGKALFSTKKYKKDSVIYILTGEIKDKPDKYTIEIGDNKHILDNYGIYMNHSFTPSVKIDGNNVVALKYIKSGDEICFNYNENETNMASPFYSNGVLISGKKI